MITIEINNPETKQAEPFNIKTKWDELTVQEYKAYHQVHEKHKGNIQKENEEEVESPIALMIYYKEMCSVILGKPINYINKIHSDDVVELINGVNEILLEYPYEEINKFTFEDTTYWFPEKLMTENSFGEYIETTQLESTAKIMKNGKFDVVAEQMARCCKTEEEHNNETILEEEVVEERAKKFEKLPMDIVWEFCFFLSNPLRTSTKNSQTYGAVRQEVEKAFKQVKLLKDMDG